MSADTELPLDLYNANLELQLRIAALIQESAQKWLELGKQAMDEALAESAGEEEQLLKTRNWQTLATLPGEAFWYQLQQRLGDAQAAARIAVESQAAFMAGVQEAIQTWQMDTTRIVDAAIAGAPLGAAWNDWFKQWNPVAPGASATATKKAAKGAGRGD